MYQLPLLSFLIWLPILGAAVVLLFSAEERANVARVIALWIVLLSLALSILLVSQFDSTLGTFQFRENLSWIPELKIQYTLGVDGISLALIVLTCFTSLLIILASWTMVHEKVAQYLAAFLVMQGMMVGVFAATDSMLFYFFWEGMLIPMYLSIGIWGAENRSYAAIKFFLYTFFGSALLLIAILYLRIQADSFYIPDFYTLPLALSVQIVIFIGFLFAFAIKVPMWPVHTWLPDAHTEAPVGGSVILAALMLKMGAYGFLRFSLPIVPDACRLLEWLMITLSLIAIVYIGLIAIAQTDMKKLIAYSSVAHMGFVTLGLFIPYLIVARTFNLYDPNAYLGMEGAVVQMISHAFGSGAMFLAFGILYQQLHTRLIKDFGGIANTMPIFSALFMIFALSNIGLPGTSGFVGEFMVILSIFKTSFWIAFFASATLIIGAAYTLWMYKRVFFGVVVHPGVQHLHDIRGVDLLIFILLAGAIFWIGVYPAALLHLLQTSVDHLLDLSVRSKLI